MPSQPVTKRMVKGACPQDCPDCCAMLYHVEDEKLIQVTGNPENPLTNGRLCVKLKDFAGHHAHPDRLMYPMKRTGPKGSGKFERISWDQALEEIKTQWQGIIAEYGPQAIYPHCYAGQIGTLNGMTSGDRFFNALGSTVAEKTYCGSAASVGWVLTNGAVGGLDPESFAYSKFIIVWGQNTLSTQSHSWPAINAARVNGAKVIVIDPVRTRTAKQADMHIAIKPGTDGALAMGMIHVITQERLYDANYVGKHTVGFVELKERAAEYTPERVAEICGISTDEVQMLARGYAEAKESAIRMGVSIERTPGGGQAVRAISCLPSLIGAWKYPGGGATQMTHFQFPLKWDNLSRGDWIKPGTRVINQFNLGQALAGEMPLDPPIKSLFVYNSNPLAACPNQSMTRKGMAREDLFTVVSELFMTDTAKYADIVLPATMQAEQLDVMWSWGHFYIQLNQPAIEPPGETVSNTELFRRLSKVMGLTRPQLYFSDEDLVSSYVDWNADSMKGISLDYLKEHGFARLNVGGLPHERTPHAAGDFGTPSGKCEFVASAAAGGSTVGTFGRQGYTFFQDGSAIDPLPRFTPPEETADANPKLAQKYSLNLLSGKAHSFLNSQYANEVKHLKREGGQQSVLINSADAAARGIEKGAAVLVFNKNGRVKAVAEVGDDVREGVVFMTFGFWANKKNAATGPNALCNDKNSDMGMGGTMNDTLVEVALA
jgi:anaerobic selenocysteine-containing dehydrogenase